MSHEAIHWVAVAWFAGPLMVFAFLAELIGWGAILAVAVIGVVAWLIVFHGPNEATTWTTAIVSAVCWAVVCAVRGSR